MINTENLHTAILSEIEDVLRTDRNIKVKEDIKLFLRVLTFPIDEENLKGIETRMPSALQKILLDSTNKQERNSVFPDVAKLEPFLRKIMFLIDSTKYLEFERDKIALSGIIDFLGLNVNHINFNWETLTDRQASNFGIHLFNSYKLRNLESHVCKNWSHYQIYNQLRSILSTYIFAVSKHRTGLQNILYKDRYERYLETEVKNFEKVEKFFIHIDGKESFDTISLLAKELTYTDDFDSKEDITPREGTLEHIKSDLSERRMLVYGEVGMGKSTSLLYLHLQDCRKALKAYADSPLIPIYIELKNFIKEDTLVEKIAGKTNLEKEKIILDLKRGQFVIYLDGLNEIDKSSQSTTLTHIKSAIDNYPKNFYVLASRPQRYSYQANQSPFGKEIPIFVLQRMKDEQIKEYLKKNCPADKEKIWLEISTNDRLKQLVNTPLMLAMLVAVVKREKNIPADKAKILQSFVNSIYTREIQRDVTFKQDEFHILMCNLAYFTRELTGSNAGIEQHQYVIPFLEDKKASIGLNTNLIEFIQKALELNILTIDNNHLSFFHEIYQEYYAAEHFLR